MDGVIRYPYTHSFGGGVMVVSKKKKECVHCWRNITIEEEKRFPRVVAEQFKYYQKCIYCNSLRKKE